MNRNIIIVIFILCTSFFGYAEQVSEEQASQAARNFFFERGPNTQAFTPDGLIIKTTYVNADPGLPLYYVFNLDPEGWIAIAADDAVFPILAYSFEGSYEESNQAPQFTAWMKQYEDQIRYAIRENVAPYPRAVEMWNKLTDLRFYPSPDPSPQREGNQPETRNTKSESFVLRSVEPLITSHWNQSPWYNELCPADPAGPGGHCVAGCVPVCMAQVMYYFRWPETGTGSYTYTEPNYGVLTADFGATTYKWNEMTNSINRSNLAIAELIYHLGVSCDLQYGPSGSGMYNHKAAYSLRSFFKYAPGTQYLYRDSTTLNWDSVLIAHLDRKIPMYYAGWSVPDTSGHAFVCDGYQDSCFFHFNFGWGGSNDGYFYTSDLTPGGYNFNLAQEVVIHCFPDTVNYAYPVQCSGNLEFIHKVGSFEDGSGPVDDYLPTANCSWLIAPQTIADSVTSITLNFDRFDTNPDDFVTVHNGGTTSDPVIGNYSGDQLPPEIVSSGNQLLITFEATGNPPANGFLANYKANQPVWCSSITTIKSDTAEITDGSFDFNYYNNSSCKWKVETESGDPLTVYFEYFDTEEGHDFLTIYDLGTGDTLVRLSGKYAPGSLPDSVTSPSGKMFLVFMTNSTITANGWKLYYPKKPNIGIDDVSAIRNLQLFPNPASNQVTIQFFSFEASPIHLVIFTADSRPVREAVWESTPGKNVKEIDLTGLQAGIYLVRMTGDASSHATKLVIN
ncbi:MAG: C10 family peptidase [Bacteroidales bacterium]|nr:C10 family peptidase [Bacteroidales bacterium]